MAIGANTPERDKEILSGMKAMDNSIGSLHVAIDRLNEILQPYMHSTSPSEASKRVTGNTTKFGAELGEMVISVDLAIEQVNDIINRLEI